MLVFWCMFRSTLATTCPSGCAGADDKGTAPSMRAAASKWGTNAAPIILSIPSLLVATSHHPGRTASALLLLPAAGLEPLRPLRPPLLLPGPERCVVRLLPAARCCAAVRATRPRRAASVWYLCCMTS